METKLHQRIDYIEKLYIEKGWSTKRLAKKFELTIPQMRKVLMDVGLEVDGKVKPGLMTQAEAEVHWAGKNRIDSVKET